MVIPNCQLLLLPENLGMNQTELREILSFNIKQKRKLYSLTQEKLAELTGLSAQTINDIEGCRTWVSDKTLVKIAEILHSNPSELLYENTNNKDDELNLLQLKKQLQESILKTIEDTFSYKKN